MLRLGILTSGGDCQALNATMRGIVKTVLLNSEEPVEIYGFRNGYRGLIDADFRMLGWNDFSGILTRGGTILGTSRVPFKTIDDVDEEGVSKVERMKHTYHKLMLDCLCVLGGNGSTKTANRLSEEGLNVIALPKTIDNDTWGTDLTFGFHSALEIATKFIDDIHTTASSHGRVFVIEIMGHKVGWIPLYAGIAGGADVILLPEIPYDIENVCDVVEQRTKGGANFAIIAVAEGAISKEEAALSKKEYKTLVGARTSPSVAYEIADQIAARTGREVRVGIPGHTQRGGQPCPYDRVFATQVGAEAGRAVLAREFGFMVADHGREIVRVPLAEIADKLKYVDPQSQLIAHARSVGISFGDEPARIRI